LLLCNFATLQTSLETLQSFIDDFGGVGGGEEPVVMWVEEEALPCGCGAEGLLFSKGVIFGHPNIG
jgi:hypothetical protein